MTAALRMLTILIRAIQIRLQFTLGYFVYLFFIYSLIYFTLILNFYLFFCSLQGEQGIDGRVGRRGTDGKQASTQIFFSDFRLTLKMRGDSFRKCSSLVLQANTVDNPNLALTGTTIDNGEQFLFPFRSFPYTFILDNSNHVLSA